MEHKNSQILKILCTLPRKIVSLHGYENVPEFVLHELCHASCFNLARAAYFVDNPDFNCIKGVAGFSQQETLPGTDTIWQDPDSFSLIMQSSPFNQQVRNIIRHSHRKNPSSDHNVLENISQELHLVQPQYFSWNMKHDNHGILIYEKNGAENGQNLDEHLHNSVYLLSFCPIF